MVPLTNHIQNLSSSHCLNHTFSCQATNRPSLNTYKSSLFSYFHLFQAWSLLPTKYESNQFIKEASSYHCSTGQCLVPTFHFQFSAWFRLLFELFSAMCLFIGSTLATLAFCFSKSLDLFLLRVLVLKVSNTLNFPSSDSYNTYFFLSFKFFVQQSDWFT